MSVIAQNIYRNLNEIGLLLLRLGVSGLMLTHGFPKLKQLVAGGDTQFADPIGVGATVSLVLAVLGEFVAPLFLLVGLFTRLAAIPSAAVMAVAAFVVHRGQPLPERELALLYLVGFVGLMLTGPGRYSIDELRTKRAP
jgi:putative oxidoreductase